METILKRVEAGADPFFYDVDIQLFSLFKKEKYYN